MRINVSRRRKGHASLGCNCEACVRERKLFRTRHRRPHRPEQTHEPKRGGRYNRRKEEKAWRDDAGGT